MTTLSSSSLCIDASRNRQCTPHKKPDVANAIQKMCDNNQIKTMTLSPLIPMDACFWVMVTPTTINKRILCHVFGQREKIKMYKQLHNHAIYK